MGRAIHEGQEIKCCIKNVFGPTFNVDEPITNLGGGSDREPSRNRYEANHTRGAPRSRKPLSGNDVRPRHHCSICTRSIGTRLLRIWWKPEGVGFTLCADYGSLDNPMLIEPPGLINKVLSSRVVSSQSNPMMRVVPPPDSGRSPKYLTW